MKGGGFASCVECEKILVVTEVVFIAIIPIPHFEKFPQ